MFHYVFCYYVFHYLWCNTSKWNGTIVSALQRSPFLKIGATFAFLQSSGTSPECSDLLKMTVSIGATAVASCLNTLRWIWSGHIDLFGLRFSSSFCTSSDVIRSSSISGYGLSVSVTGGSSSSGVGSEKTDLNCSFKISALSLGLSHNVPLYFSGFTPTESVFLCYTIIQTEMHKLWKKTQQHLWWWTTTGTISSSFSSSVPPFLYFLCSYFEIETVSKYWNCPDSLTLFIFVF